MKGIISVSFVSLLSISLYAHGYEIATIISIENRTNHTLEMTGSSIGCGPPQAISAFHKSETIHCLYEGTHYYDFMTPATTLAPGASTEASVISYRNHSFGRLGVQYSYPNAHDEITCGLIMDFSDHTITKIQLNSLFPDQPLLCSYIHNGYYIHVIFSEKTMQQPAYSYHS